MDMVFPSYIVSNVSLKSINVWIPYSGYNLRGAISANHQNFLLEVIFAIVKFANYSRVYIYAPAAY